MPKKAGKRPSYELVCGKFVSTCIVIVLITTGKSIMAAGGKVLPQNVCPHTHSVLLRRLFSPEIRLLRSWISNYWLRWVQALSTLSLIASFFAVIAALLVLRNRDGFKSSKNVLIAAVLHGIAGVLMLATVILFGVDGKRRDWMMNWQFNWFGWSFQLAIVSCILHLLTAMMAGYQGSNR